MSTAVIVPTYNSPGPLRRCLLGFAAQTDQNFELIIADDGSDDPTQQVLSDSIFSSLTIRHLWHEDRGFRKSKILNKAIASTSADYIVFCDGDSIPRKDFVEKHLYHSRPNCFLSGTRVDVMQYIHERFQDDDILENRVFDFDYLIKADPNMTQYRHRLRQNSMWEGLMNLFTYRYCVFHGSNASAWRKDLEKVNGFDESYGNYGSEDRDLGVRLRNAGIRSKFLKFSLVQLHQGHDRPYAEPVSEKSNRLLFRSRFFNGITRVEPGIDTASQRS